MDRIYSDTSDEKDVTEGTIKRRISSILKAPRTPLRDLEIGNEVIQDCNIEKHQKNSRRVSFADTIRVFPPDPQITVELKPAETVGEPRDQDLFNKHEDPEVVCEITGMDTLLHAPIQTSLQQPECGAEINQEWNKMDRTVIFSEENEMDMTSGHTITITHDIRICQQTDKSRKINFKSFSAELKSEKKSSQMNQFSSFSSPMKMKDTSLSPQKLNTPKINFSDFLDSLKSTVNTFPIAGPERNVCSSKENIYSHLYEENCNTATVSEVLHDNRQNHTASFLSKRNAITLPSRKLACGQENMDTIITNMENVLPPGTSSLNMVNSQKNFWEDCTISCNMNSGRSKTSRGQFGVQEDQTECVNEIAMNNIGSIADKHIKIKKDASLDYHKTSIMPVRIGSVGFKPVFHADKASAFPSFSANMELTKNSTGLILEENSKGICYPVHGDFEKQRNNVSRLMEGTTFREEHMDIRNNQALSFNERAIPAEEVTYDKMGLLNPRMLGGPLTSYITKRKENNCSRGEEPSRASVLFLKNSKLNSSQVAKSFGSQAECQFLPLADDMQQAHKTVGENKINKTGLSNNAISLIPEDKTTIFHFSENMEITKPTIDLSNNSRNAVGFQAMPQQGMSWKNVTGPNNDKTVIFSLSEDNEMEITKNYTVPIHYDMQQCNRTPQVLSIQSMDESLSVYNNMEETKAITGMIDQFIEHTSGQTTQKQSNESERRTVTGTTKDRTIVFSLSGENEMEITQSHTVALKHDVVTKGKDIPISSVPFSNKTSMFTVGGDMEITEAVGHETDKSLKKAVNSCAMLDQDTRPDKERVTGSASGKNGSADMELTKSLTVAVEGTEVLSPISAEKNSMSVYNSVTASKSTHFVPANKTTVFMHNNDMEITKPITYTPIKDPKGLQMEKEETRNVILSGRTTEETTVYEDNAMEITKSHTVAVNDVLQQVKVAPRRLTLVSVDETSTFALLSDATTQSKALVPAGKPFMYNDMEITKTQSDTFVKNNCFTSLSQCKRTPQVLACQDSMNTTGFHTVTKENSYKSMVKLGNHDEKELSSNQMVADDARVDTRHTMSLDNKTDLPCKPAIQTKLSFPVSMIRAVTSCWDSTKLNNSLPNTTHNENLEDTKRKEMPNKNTKQNMNKLLSDTCDEKVQDVEVTKNLTVSIYGLNNDVPDAEKEILNSFTKSKEKTVVFSDGNNMEMTRNYTTGIEFVNMNDNNECHLNSEAKFNSGFPLVNAYGNKLDIAKTEKSPSICLASAMLPICSDTELDTEGYIKMKENQPDLYTSIINNSAKEFALNIVSDEGNDSILPSKDPVLPKETTPGLNQEKMPILVSEIESLKNDPKKYQSEQEARPFGGTGTLQFDDKVREKCEKMSCEWDNITKDCQNNLESPPINAHSSEANPVHLSELSGVDNSCPKLKDTGKKSELILVTQDVVSSLGDVLPKLTVKPSPLGLKENLKKELDSVASTEWTNNGFTEGTSLNVPLNTMCTESCNIKKLPLGIFPPKLPNKRKSALFRAENTTFRSEEKKKIEDSEMYLHIKSSSLKTTQNSSPSYYINEELLPEYEEEMDSNEFCDMPEKQDKGIAGNEGYLSEGLKTNKRQRALNQEDDELQKEKKLKEDEGWSDSAVLRQPLCSTVLTDDHRETQEGKNVPELTAMNLEKTQSSNSSSLDSVKADTDFSIQQNSEMETQHFMDSICEQNLREKLQEGTITVREFFTLLEVHILIQKPRQSLLPPKYEVNTVPTLEDELISQYVYRPKLLAYDEDCQALCKIIEELNVHAGDQEKLLVNVHKSLWEVMRTCSDEELKGFGGELNKMKSCFTKKSKVLAHKGKAKLYAKLVQNAQVQWEKLQSRLAKMDELLKEIDGCINDLETEAAALEASELDVNDAVSEYKSKVTDTEKELENLRVQEEILQRDQSNLREKKQQIACEVSQLQEYATNCQEITEKYHFSEWVMKEWNDHQAVFTFLYDSIELVVGLEHPVDGAVYSNKIVSVNFESLLDEAKALPSSKLVHKLIFQFINSQSSWKEKCLTVHHLSQMLHDISLVVNRCQLLGEEIEFLNKWGGKFSLLRTEVLYSELKVKLLFSSSFACAKFEVEISLSANYPASPIAFTIQKCTGRLGQEDISMVLSGVPVGANYLRRIVKQISHNLLQCSPQQSTNSKEKLSTLPLEH